MEGSWDHCKYTTSDQWRSGIKAVEAGGLAALALPFLLLIRDSGDELLTAIKRPAFQFMIEHK